MDSSLPYLLVLFVLATPLVRYMRSDPLSHFPGPNLAKWTRIYRAYYDVVIGGGWLAHLQRLHKTYGPVVRVGPYELHFADSVAYNEIYNSQYRMTKDPTFYRPFEFGLHSVLFSTLNPKEHSAIKSLYSSYFSQKGVHRLEHIIQERVDKLVSQLSLNHKTSPVNMNHAFRSVTLDVITLYTLRTSLNATSFPSFRHPAILSMDAAISTVWIFTHLPFLRNAFNLPKWLSALVAPSSKPMAEMQAEVEKLVDKALRDYHHYDSDSDTELNVFYTLLHNAQIDGKLKQSSRVTRDWLIAEGVSLRIAGSDTVGNTCTIGARCLARDEGVRAKLLEELEAAWPNKGDRMSLGRLEKLPYLTAVIKESLRLSHGVITPMSRVVPESGAIIAGHTIPAGTIVATGNSFVHLDPNIFPDPERFYPERWLEDKDGTLDRYLVPFGKGTRACLGINLAWCELYMLFGNVFRKLDFHCDGNLWSEVQFREYFTPLYDDDVFTVTVSERL